LTRTNLNGKHTLPLIPSHRRHKLLGSDFLQANVFSRLAGVEMKLITKIEREDVRDLFGTRKALENGQRAESLAKQNTLNPSSRNLNRDEIWFVGNRSLGKAARLIVVIRTGFLIAGLVFVYWFQDFALDALGPVAATVIPYFFIPVVFLGFLEFILRSTFDFQKSAAATLELERLKRELEEAIAESISRNDVNEEIAARLRVIIHDEVRWLENQKSD
jgi:hypothetical protein